jgi:parallel beta-helix repeat protein
MSMKALLRAHLLVPALVGGFLAGCGGGGDDPPAGSTGTVTPRFVTTQICTGPDAQAKALAALFDAHEGDTIEFCKGEFNFTTGLILHSKRGITIKGAGKGDTKLSFDNSDSAEGINVSYSDGVTIQGLTVEDTPGNSIRIFKSNYVTLRDVGAGWSDRDPDTEGHQVSPENGAYALYPVECTHVLIEDSYAYGSSDAGVYVGQSSDIVVRNSLAKYNVAGYEFENTYRAVFEDNIATENTGGFLVFDLPDLRQYGEKNVVRNNKSYNNNYDNFAPVGNIVGVVPRGTGMLVLSTDQLEISGNEIYDNDTVGLAIVNFGLVDKNYPDVRYDHFPEGIEIHDNIFRDNGGNPQEPNPDRGEASALPAILKFKNNGFGAHIVWDGGVDSPNNCTSCPKDKDGRSLCDPTVSKEPGRYEARMDERGRPNYSRTDQNPECTGTNPPERKYNKWKFEGTATAPRKPENWLCINHQPADSFQSTRPATATTTPFLNAHFPTAAQEDIPGHLLTPGSTDMEPHDCDLPSRVADLRPLSLPFTPDPASASARPSPEQIAAACGAATGTQVNTAALLLYNCPELKNYNLFASATNPLANPNGGGVPFELNSALFSDYASKYRFLFIPAGKTATYRDHNTGATQTLEFPIGTVIAKSFTFRKENASGVLTSEDVVETRLLIKREVNGGPFWVGLPYIWEKDSSGKLTTAKLHVEGGTASVTYDYLDPDPDVKTGANRTRYTNNTAHPYGIPAALNCLTCHAGDDREPGAAPIGLKPRFMNRANAALGGKNQLEHLKDVGLLTGMPGAAGTLEKAPRWNVPGDANADAALDKHLRVRAYLEVNCAHCHNSNGNASNSGLGLDAYRAVDLHYGICKKPVAAGRGSGGRQYDIVPYLPQSPQPEQSDGASASILYYRVASAEAGVRMPPVARTVVHAEAASLIADWINNVLPTADTQDADSCSLPRTAAPEGGTEAVPLLSPDQRRVLDKLN